MTTEQTVPVIPDAIAMADPLPEIRLARRWGTSLRTLQRRRRDGHVPPWFRVGRAVVYPWPGIIAFEADGMAREGR